VAGVAVVEERRSPREQARDDHVPHHPARGREPEEAVLGRKIYVQHGLLQMFDEDAALAVHDGLRQAGGPRGVEHPQRVVEGHLFEAELGALVLREQLVPRRHVLQRTGVRFLLEVRQDHGLLEAWDLLLELRHRLCPVVVLSTVTVAVHRE
jgi:hypothetical protein